MPMEVTDPKYGIPQLKKFPMPDARHVRSAIKFFNYVTPKYEKQLAAAILRRMKEYGLSFDDFTVGDENRFKKYMPQAYLAHYGTLGMHWGIRRFQPYPSDYHGDGKFTGNKQDHNRDKGKQLVDKTLSKNLSKAKCNNLDKWGKTEDTNTLYITGYSGGGKSTIAKFLESKNVNVIHLDSYFESNQEPNNSSFNKYLKEEFPDYLKLKQNFSNMDKSELGRLFADFEDAIEGYGKDQFKRGNRVIAEGVELLDDTIRPDKDYFSDKPVIVTTTNAIVSNHRANVRDDYKYDDFEDVKAHVKWYTRAHKDIKNFSKKSGAYKSRNGKEYINYK